MKKKKKVLKAKEVDLKDLDLISQDAASVFEDVAKDDKKDGR